jgi:hypothetical protein
LTRAALRGRRARVLAAVIDCRPEDRGRRRLRSIGPHCFKRLSDNTIAEHIVDKLVQMEPDLGPVKQ